MRLERLDHRLMRGFPFPPPRHSKRAKKGSIMNYQDFIENKQFKNIECDYDQETWFPDDMFQFQRDCCEWALKRGRSSLFLDTGLGKTIIQLTWAQNIHQLTGMPVIIVAPLCVATQTVREGVKFGIESEYTREQSQARSNIHVVNYEMLKHFNPDLYGGIVLDESSILKGMDGKMRRSITEFGSDIQYRLSCTATPSPNDFMELGTQSEFLGIMSQVEMLAMFFIHDGSDTSKWRLKGHGAMKFWQWLSTWAIVLSKPSDLGYDDTGYDLPDLIYHEHIVETSPTDDMFVTVAQGLQDRNKARKDSVNERIKKAADIANNSFGPCLVWCNLNDESAKLEDKITGSRQVTGSMKPELKERSALDFIDGTLDKLISKPKIFGYGLNFQHCNNIIFVGLSDSWESFYQAIRRCWRFGQTKPVNVHIISADTEGAVLGNIKRKEQQNKIMKEKMSDIMRSFTIDQIKSAHVEKTQYKPAVQFIKPTW
jgi:hypothetical protein